MNWENVNLLSESYGIAVECEKSGINANITSHASMET